MSKHPMTLADRAALLRQAAALMSAHGIPGRELGHCAEGGRFVRLDGAGVVRVYVLDDSCDPLAQSLPGRPLELDPAARLANADGYIAGMPALQLRWAMRLATALSVPPHVVPWHTKENQINAPRFMKWTYLPGVLSVYDAFTGQCLCESVAGQMSVLNERLFTEEEPARCPV